MNDSANHEMLEARRSQIQDDLLRVNLSDDIKRLCQSLSQVSFNQRNQDFMVEICCKLHEYYDDFSTHLVAAILKQYREPQAQSNL